MLLQPNTRGLYLSLLAARAYAQVTLTGCHLHEGQEVCLLPDGVETTITSESMASPTAPISNPVSMTTSAQVTAITGCRNQGTAQVCFDSNGAEVQVLATATGNEPLPTAYTGCHAHGVSEMFCEAPDGSEVEVVAAGVEEGHGDQDHDDYHTSEASTERNCHFHAGVEHCTGGSEATCERTDRDYNVSLRIGLLFVVLATSAIAVYAPILMRRLLNVNPSGTTFTVVKQFGTGIIIATALIHLMTHAELMFGNECLGELKYEATATSIAMAGAFLAFLIDFIGHRAASWRRSSSQEASVEASIVESLTEEAVKPSPTSGVSRLANLSHHHDNLGTTLPNDALSVMILEAGIIFHSLLLGLTLVVAGDSVFITLFVVIVFHQMFEGLALGARIAAVDGMKKTKYILLPLAFAFVTPTGMAIGIGVLNHFNGNDPSTIVAIGTLDAVSAGILLWVGLVSMWAHDWMYGELRDARFVKTLVALVSLIAGMALMGLLGKWA